MKIKYFLEVCAGCLLFSYVQFYLLSEKQVSSHERGSRILNVFDSPLESWQEENDTSIREMNALANPFYQVDRTDMFVKSAVFDPRINSAPVVRLLVLTPMKNMTVYCHVRFGTGSTVVVQAEVIIQRVYFESYCKWVTATMKCPLKTLTIPDQVSVSSSAVDTQSQWHAIRSPQYKPPDMPKYGICLNKLFNLNDNDVEPLVEWFEMQKILGVHNVIVYGTHNVSRRIHKVLQTYFDSGFVLFRPWILPFPSYTPMDYKNNPRLKQQDRCVAYHAQHLIFTDCLYRYMDIFTYLAFIDIDEYIIPAMGETWQDMFKKIESRKKSVIYASYNIPEACFEKEDDFQESGTSGVRLVTKAISRLSEFRMKTGYVPHYKSIVKPQYVDRLYIHDVKAVIPPMQEKIKLPPSFARLHHYKNPGLCNINSTNFREDMYIYKYHDQLVSNMQQTLKTIR